SLLDQAVWKYAGVLMAQPFEVAKMILQVRVAQEHDLDDIPSRAGSHVSDRQQETEELADSSDEEPNFFTSNGPLDQSTRPRHEVEEDDQHYHILGHQATDNQRPPLRLQTSYI
ncbi:MAG: hypothetical protein M1823_008934, partial [Watsoniomyces obsoletus]